MNKLILLVLLVLPMMAQAQVMGGLNMILIESENELVDISMGGFEVSIGYSFELDDNWTIQPEISFGNSDSDRVTVSGINMEIEIEKMTTIAVRVQRSFDTGLYAYVAPSKAKIGFKVSAVGLPISISGEESETAVIYGMGYKATDSLSIEYSMASYGEFDFMSFGINFNF